MWFGESPGDANGAAAVARITPSGQIVSRFATGGTGIVRGITRGPDNAMWFVEGSAQRIGRMALDGTVTSVPLPAGLSVAGSQHPIVAGRDGALWTIAIRFIPGQVPTPNTDRVLVRTVPGGSAMEVPGAHPSQALAPSPDGSVWYTGHTSAGGIVGHASASGAVNEFPLPVVGLPGDLAVGPDGNAWVVPGFNLATSATTRALERVTPAGAITSVPTPVQVGSMVTAADGNVWYSFGSLFRLSTVGISTLAVPEAGISELGAGLPGQFWSSDNPRGEIIRVDPPAAAPAAPKLAFAGAPSTARLASNGTVSVAFQTLPGAAGTVKLTAKVPVAKAAAKTRKQTKTVLLVPTKTFRADAKGAVRLKLKVTKARRMRLRGASKKVAATLTVKVAGATYRSALTLRR
jgi:virginiamycin B lyase